MCATAAHLVERVLPAVDLRQWVLTFPFAWRKRLAQDGALFSRLSRLFVETVSAFYAERGCGPDRKTGAVTVVQRTSSDLRLNLHLHVVFLDGTYARRDGELAWTPLGHLKTSEVGEGLERALRRIDKHLRRHGLLEHDEDGDDDTDPEDALAASAVSGQVPPAGPQWTRRLARSGEHLLVDVVDDGVGIQRDAVARSASGLEHLRARAAGLAAELTVEATKEGRGTTVRLRIPWPTDATGERRCRGERARPATVRSGSV